MNFGPAMSGDNHLLTTDREEVFLCPDFDKNLITYHLT